MKEIDSDTDNNLEADQMVVSYVFNSLIDSSFAAIAHDAIYAAEETQQNMQLSLIIPATVRVKNVNDIAINNFANDNIIIEEFCVFSSSGSYDVTLNSANSDDTNFIMRDGNNEIKYRARFANDNSNGYIAMITIPEQY